MIGAKLSLAAAAALMLVSGCRGTARSMPTPSVVLTASAQATDRPSSPNSPAVDSGSPTMSPERNGAPTSEITSNAPTAEGTTAAGQEGDQRRLDEACTRLSALRSCECVKRSLVQHFGTAENAAMAVATSTTAQLLSVAPELRACFGD